MTVSEYAAVSTRPTSWTGTDLLNALTAAEQWLQQHVSTINALNVFPVPDGDTGTNMHMTLAAALRDVLPHSSCAQVSEQVYRGALMGARGNSGVILSQILRGVAQGLAGHEQCGPAEWAHALVQASTTAYRGASEPREGTILTVIRETSVAAQRALETADADLTTVLSAAVVGAHTAVERTPTLLKVLEDAGVVDAGGQGLYVILEGMLRWAQGDIISLPQEHGQALISDLNLAFKDMHAEDDFGYCTNILLCGERLPCDEIRQHMNAVGTSVVVVGDTALIRIHVHTLRPGDILNYVMQFGELLNIEITNMNQQHALLHGVNGRNTHSAVHAGTPDPPGDTDVAAQDAIGLVAVAPGPGFAAIFRSLRVGAVVTGGQTMNPSTQELVAAIESLPQDAIIVLPNNSNVIMAAQQAAEITTRTKQVQVLPSKTVPQGIAAMMAFGYQRDLDANVAAMQREMQRVVTAEITTAVRDALIDGVAVQGGQTIGLLNGDLLVAGDDREQVIDNILARMGLEALEILTIYYGQHISAEHAHELASRLGIQYPEYDIEVRSGGQPFYDYIFSAE